MSGGAIHDLAPAPVWNEGALCAQVDPDIWYPEKGESARPAKKICLDCPIKIECLQWALDNGERYGIWGGMSERERRELLRKPPVTRTVCGTVQGYQIHLFQREKPCNACADAR